MTADMTVVCTLLSRPKITITVLTSVEKQNNKISYDVISYPKLTGCRLFGEAVYNLLAMTVCFFSCMEKNVRLTQLFYFFFPVACYFLSYDSMA